MFHNIRLLVVLVVTAIVTINGLPTSDLNAKDVPLPKVKRANEAPQPVGAADPQTTAGLDPALNALYVEQPVKRGGGGVPHRLNVDPMENGDSLMDDAQLWESPDATQEAGLWGGAERYPLGLDDDKTLAEYEKGFRYGTNRAKLAESLENAVLKSELYGQGVPAVNQYRYYGGSGGERRKRGSGTPMLAHKTAGADKEKQAARLTPRYKRELDLSSDEVLALLSLWEAQRDQQHKAPQYNPYASMYRDDNDIDGADGDSWYDGPVVPASGAATHFPHELGYQYAHVQNYPQMYNKYQPYPVKKQWAGPYPVHNMNKRFMVAKKRSEPDYSRFLGYPMETNYNKDDELYTLADLIGSAPRYNNMPVVRRPML